MTPGIKTSIKNFFDQQNMQKKKIQNLKKKFLKLFCVYFTDK